MRKPSRDFQTRFDSAKRWRDQMRATIEDVYRFCAPGREKEFGATPPNADPEAEVYVAIGEEMATDLAGDLVNYFTPPETLWYEIVASVPEDDPFEDEILKALIARERDVSDLITRSNYNDIAPQILFEAATHGTPAVWVQKAHLQQPIFFETVPPSELLITPGHLGILDRFRQKQVPSWTLDVLFEGMAGVTLSEQMREKMKRPDRFSEVIWGFWARWTDPARPTWVMQITVDGHAVCDETDLGDLAGACPLLVGRFNPQPNKPWGRGPGIKALPDLRVLNKIEEVVLTGLDSAILNTIIYPDDSTLDLSDGLEAGRAYAAGARFDGRSIFTLPKDTRLDYGWTSEDKLEGRIRTSFYQDGPRQRGDTPPTAAQWFDERRRVQQRLGKPSAPLWTELFFPMLQRIEHLGTQAGALDPQISVDGNVISATPISPLQKAQNHEAVMISRSNLELAVAINPEGAGVAVDTAATLKAIVKASGDKLTVVRDEEKPLAPAAPPQG